ncbi:MAG: 3-oxoacyl-[acyl-carrier-protein] reductase [Christensenellales bacterium]|jgi:3-oxoacyl-[acyl-carrier protein] reductase
MMDSKTALVTGASRGIGREIALYLARSSFRVVVNYVHSRDAAYCLVEEIRSGGGEAEAFAADVGDFAQAKALIDFCVQNFGQIDVLVNNAGITRDALIARMKEQEFDEVVETNLKSVFNCCRHVAPLMMRRREGCIINISSVSGVMGNAGQANYAASKAGVIGMTKSLARELAGRGVRVNAVAPGFIETDMTQALPEATLRGALAAIPMKRAGSTREVAAVVGFLCSDAAAYITGQVICVDGGMAM